MSEFHRYKDFLNKSSLRQAALVLSNKKMLEGLIGKVKNLRGEARGLKAKFSDMIRMLVAWKKGEYKSVSKTTLLLCVGAIIYFVTPLDMIPDFIPITGFIDDSAVLAYVLRRISVDLIKFKTWESNQI